MPEAFMRNLYSAARLMIGIGALFCVVTSFGQRLPRPENYLIRNPLSATPQIEWIPASAFKPLPPDTPPTVRPATQPVERVNAVLQQWLAQRPQSERVRVLVTMIEDLPELVLPRLKSGVAPEGAENAGIVVQRREMMAQRTAERQHRHAARLARVAGAILLESYPIANVMHVELPLAAISGLLADKDVQYIESATAGPPPPTSLISDGRHYIATDWWAYTIFPMSNNRNVPWERIALLDTGVRSSHDLLSTQINAMYDCANAAPGSGTCTTAAPGHTLNPYDNLNHGTASANIISGNGSYGDDYKGVSQYRINSYKVYDDASGGALPDAVLRAFTASMINGDHIVVAELQFAETQDGAIASAADVAASNGQTVVAAIGNGALPGYADNTLPRSPAVARKVLGIGAVDMATGSVIAPQSQGPTPDGRIKPDVQFPGNVYTASNASNSAIRTDTFNDTSCATAFAGGAAGILWNLLCDCWIPQQYAWHQEYPGLIYAWAIMLGRNASIPDNLKGAGGALFASNWCQSGEQYPNSPDGTVIGEVTFSHTSNVTYDFQFSNNWSNCSAEYGCRCAGSDGGALPPNTADVAIWWEESAQYAHIDFNLFLFDQNGLLKASSLVSGSVFQKIHFTGDFSANQYDHPLVARIVPRTTPDHDVRLHLIASLSRW